MSRQSKPSIVFVHGIWADGSCFSKVIPTLQAEGYEVVSSQHSLDTLTGDVATVTRTLARVGHPAILVGIEALIQEVAQKSSILRNPLAVHARGRS